MPSRARGNRPTLEQGLDREVYQIVRKLADEHLQYGGGTGPRLSVPSVYGHIKGSNSSLNRKNRKLLEGSIERVLAVVVKDETAGGEDEDEDEEEEEESSSEADRGGRPDGSRSRSGGGGGGVAQANGLMNKSIVGMWSTTTSSKSSKPSGAREGDGASTPATSSNFKRRHQAAASEPAPKRRKGDSSVDRSPPTHVSLADLGGVDDVIQELEDLIVLPMTRPQIFSASKVQPPRGVLLHGPPGCGKTMIANAFAAELGVPFIAISAPSIVSGMSGESEKALRDFFDEARRIAPCLVFVDEIDAITPKRESAQREMEKRIVAQLLTCMDDLALEKTDGKPVIILAATNRPDSLDPALRRGGRFDKEINMTVPSEPVREQILRALTRDMRLDGGIDLKLLAKRTPGFVGADLSDLVSTSASGAIKRYLELLKSHSSTDLMDIEDDRGGLSTKVWDLRRLIKHAREALEGDEPGVISVTNEDFFKALPKIQPSSKREGFATIPDTTWADVGALRPIRQELVTAVVEPIRSPERYAAVGITAPAGVLLWGPPGCGKTLLAKAVANESRANFISVKGPELLNKYVGESERAVRQVFVRARSSIPCVIFFDELDALVPRRDDTLSESSARVVNTLLTELDGLGSSREGIYVIAATNRPDIIDPAMLRPGRLETLLFVDLPGANERVEILGTLLRKMPVQYDEAIKSIARKCDGFSGADLESLVRRAGYKAIRRNGEGGEGIVAEDFLAARNEVRPSVVDIKKYDRLKREWGDGMA